MQKQQLTWNADPAIEIEIQPVWQSSPFLQLAEAPSKHRRIRVALPTLPRRQSCLTKRAMLAALREAELAEWQASGGDFMRSTQSN